MSDFKSIGSQDNSNIMDIIKHISDNGVQRSNRYSVEFLDCPIEQKTGVAFSFFATLCQIPQRTIEFYEDSVGPYSPKWLVPLKQEYDDHYIINFLVDKSWSIRDLIEDWMDYVMGQDFGIGRFSGTDSLDAKIQPTTIGTDNSSRIRIRGFGTADNKSKGSLVLYGAWPRLILPGTFDTNQNNQPLIMSVDFAYRYYKFYQEGI